MRGAVALMSLLLAATAARGEAEPLRVSGAVAADASWAGHVRITGDTSIVGATITVQPGTSIEFAAGTGEPHPRLTVGAPGQPGRLLLLGTAGQPIVVRSREALHAGCLMVHVGSGDALDWHDVEFHDLGYRTAAKPDPSMPRSTDGYFQPAITIVLDGAKSGLNVKGCRFRGCARLTVRAAARARGELLQCVFEPGPDAVSLELAGGGSGALAVRSNQFSGVVEIQAVGASFTDNRLVGPRTALAINAASSPPVEVVGNYIHNTTEADDGGYCFRSRDPEALVQGNVLRGGSYVVLEGTRRMRDNVLVGAARLRSAVGRNARTHYLVAELPGRAEFQGNLLIGPAYALLATQAARPARGGAAPEPVRDLTIRGNVFDGLGATSQAIRFNVLAREPVAATVTDNLFLRVDTLVMDESRRPGVLATADRNTVAPRPRRAWDGVVMSDKQPGDPGFGAADRVFDGVADLKLANLPDAPPPDWDAELTSGRATVAQVRDRLMAAYRAR